MATIPLLSLNDLARQYRACLVPLKHSVNTTITGLPHVEGTYSAYVAEFNLIAKEPFTFYHCGQTRRHPAKRLQEHKSELLNCKVTTFNSKSVIYDPLFLSDLVGIRINLEVLKTGLTENEAKLAEDEFSNQFRNKYGRFCLTNPSRRSI